MGDMGDEFRALKELGKERRERNLKNADDEGWNKHTEHHWFRELQGSRLDYWPSRNKFMWKNRVMVGNIKGFIKKRS